MPICSDSVLRKRTGPLFPEVRDSDRGPVTLTPIHHAVPQVPTSPLGLCLEATYLSVCSMARLGGEAAPLPFNAEAGTPRPGLPR